MIGPTEKLYLQYINVEVLSGLIWQTLTIINCCRVDYKLCSCHVMIIPGTNFDLFVIQMFYSFTNKITPPQIFLFLKRIKRKWEAWL